MSFSGVLDYDPILGWIMAGQVLGEEGLPRDHTLSDGDWFVMTPRCLDEDEEYIRRKYPNLPFDFEFKAPPRILALMTDPLDCVFGLEPGKPISITISLPNPNDEDKPGKYFIIHPKLWGVKGDQAATRSPLLHTIMQLVIEYMDSGTPRIKTSYAGTAMAWYRNMFEGREINGVEFPPHRQLPPAWREIAHASFHGGPIACLRGGSKTNAVEIDITAAYLNAMSMPLPNLSKAMYFYDPEQSWGTIRTNFGFVEALVNVPKSLGRGLPPLPLDNGRGTIYPTGIFRGVWSIDLLRYAEEECGVQVIDTFEHACFLRQFLEPYFEPLSNMWFQMDRDLAKPMYTRFWGKWGNRGGYVGYPARVVGNREGAFPSNGFDWFTSMIDQDEDTGHRPYRPDVAATIAAYNHIAVHRALRMLKPESIIAVHVDAIWTDDIEGSQRICSEIQPDRINWRSEIDREQIDSYLKAGMYPGQWRIKNSGRDRHLACGVYAHGSEIGHSGLKGKPRSEEELVRRYTMTHSPKDTQELAFAIEARNWDNDVKPLQSIDATSIAPHLHQTNHQRVTKGSPVYSSKYNNLGWLQQ